MKTIILSLVVLFIISSGCNQTSTSNNTLEKENKISEKSLIKANRYLVRTEKESIDNYIRRHKLNMKSTGTGLRYMIIKHGKGPKAKKGDIVVLDYTVQSITGDTIYSSRNSGPKIFKIGHGGVESGLEEGILLLKKGDQAKFILPSHLAFGLHGDDNKIPPQSPIIYNVKLKNLK